MEAPGQLPSLPPSLNPTLTFWIPSYFSVLKRLYTIICSEIHQFGKKVANLWHKGAKIVYIMRQSCTAFVIFTKHFTLTYLGSWGLSPLAPDKLRPYTSHYQSHSNQSNSPHCLPLRHYGTVGPIQADAKTLPQNNVSKIMCRLLMQLHERCYIIHN